MRVAYFDSVKDNRPTVRNVSWRDLVRDLTTFRRAPGKRAAPCWSPAVYRDGATSRRAAAVLAVSALVLDYDDGVSPAHALERWRGFAGVVHSSWSHRPDAPKCRVVLPLAEPVGAAIWRDVYRLVVAADGDDADPACCDVSRIYLLPATGAHDCGVSRQIYGRRLDLAPFVDRARQRQRQREASARARRPRPRQLPAEPVRLDRREVAARLECRIRGSTARGAPCPRCGENEVWFSLLRGFARCNHKNTCGWSGLVSELG